MGGEQAAKTLLQIQVASLKQKGKTITTENEEKLLSEIMQKYFEQTTPYYAAARLWVDGIIDPPETRNIIAECLAAVNENSDIPDFKTGVFQV
jgi:acetyl-CoA carboxylase carboxyltransferase component